MKFALRMAWRDFRARPSRFILYIAAIAIGVGALAAIESFRRDLSAAIELQGRNLLGADITLKSRRPFTPEQQQLADVWPGRKARLISYRTMLLDSRPGGAARLVEVQAFEDAFPFYGDLSTEPASAAEAFKRDGSILIDEVLMMQLGLQPGDEVSLGGTQARVGGALRQTPGEVPARSLIAPRVFMPLRMVTVERFEQPGMMARFEWYLAHAAGEDDPRAIVELEAVARSRGLSVDTVAERREELLGGTDRLTRYLGLMGFTSLVIGCLGVAGAVQFFVNAKRRAVAQLRCIGASLFHAGGLFAVQLVGLAVVGASLGVVVGALLARVVPFLLAPFIPVPVTADYNLSAAASAWGVGALFTLLAGLYPITRLRRISPMMSLRDDDPGSLRGLDWAGVATLVLLTGALLAFATLQLGSIKQAGMYLGGVAAVLALLALTGIVMRFACRRAIRPRWSYAMRLAVSGLYRPQNQTALLLVSLGLGIFLLNTVDVLEQHIIEDVEILDQDRPNVAMIDIQMDQHEALDALLRQYEPASIYMEPMITMRLAGINGVSVNELEDAPDVKRENWALKREFRATYRSEVKPEIEKIIAGEWIGEVEPGVELAPISLEEGIAGALAVGLGDRLTFDIHGEMIETRVVNLREADWKSMQPNFFVVFPLGVLEAAPQTMLVFTQLPDIGKRAAFQAEVARRFPNITAIDISMMMNTVSNMLGQLSAAVRSIAWMTLLAGFLVLMAILRAGRAMRLREAVLLRTIGASEGLILRYQLYELILLSLGAMLSGLILSWTASGLIVHFAMDLAYQPDPSPALIYAGMVLALVILSGWFHGRAATRAKPAEAWRNLSLSSS